jgi:hypothetical protein
MTEIIRNSERIYQQAKQLIKEKSLEEVLSDFGTLVYTGSYSLNLMTWNDIDMQFVAKDGVDPRQVIVEVHKHFLEDKELIKSQTINFSGDFKTTMPRGWYIGIQLNCLNLGGNWKLDLWQLKQKDFDANREFVDQVKAVLNSEIRTLILEIKNDLMKGQGRVPQLGSYFLYKAILKGLREKEEIFHFLKENGVLFYS